MRHKVTVESEWKCPYCGHPTVEAYDHGYEQRYGDLPRLGVCDGCGGIIVLDVASVSIVWRTRRVEGEGAAEDGLAMPVVEPFPDSAPTFADVPDEAIEQLADVAAATVLPGRPFKLVHPVHTNGAWNGHPERKPLQVETNRAERPLIAEWLDMRNLAAPVGLTALVDSLIAGTSFTTLAKAMRLRLITIFGEALAAYVNGAPTMALWNAHRPEWMPVANSIVQSYDEGSLGWKGMAQEWAEFAAKAVQA